MSAKHARIHEPSASQPRGGAAPRRELSLLDSTSIIVGVIIGAGLYQNAPQVAEAVPSVWQLMGVWLAGGLLALCGAVCYAELAAAYPHDGGDYVYLTRAFGRSMGFVFAWAELWVVRPGSVGAMAFVFAYYANVLLPLGDSTTSALVYAIGSIVVLTIVNILGVREGKWTQNTLTAAKVLGLMLLLAVAFLNPASPGSEATAVLKAPNYKFAMILIMFTYGGWSEVAYVAAEVRDVKRNILRALLIGLAAVTLIYLLVNLALVYTLGYEGLRSSPTAAARALEKPLGPRGAQLMSMLICISCLGAINGHLFTGARIYYALGKDHSMFARLGRWSPRFGTPAWSLAVQAVVTLVPVIAFGLQKDSFARLVMFTTPVFWFFFFLAGCALFVLRRVDNRTPRPYKVWGYPWTPIVFCLSSLAMLYASFAYAIENHSYEGLWSIIILTLGYLLSFYDPRPTRKKALARRRRRTH